MNAPLPPSNGERRTANVQPVKIVPEYERDVTDRRTMLVQGGEGGGVFVDASRLEATRQFLARFPKGGAL
jgi:hypothetical protein